MRATLPLLLCAMPLVLAACVEDDMSGPISGAGQEQACASAFADRVGVPMSAIRTNSQDVRDGNSVYFMQTADLNHRANCEVDSSGYVVSLNVD